MVTAGAVDQYVNPPENLNAGRTGGLDAGPFEHVAFDGGRLASALANHRRHRLSSLKLEVQHRDGHPASGQVLGDPAA